MQLAKAENLAAPTKDVLVEATCVKAVLDCDLDLKSNIVAVFCPKLKYFTVVNLEIHTTELRPVELNCVARLALAITSGPVIPATENAVAALARPTTVVKVLPVDIAMVPKAVLNADLNSAEDDVAIENVALALALAVYKGVDSPDALRTEAVRLLAINVSVEIPDAANWDLAFATKEVVLFAATENVDLYLASVITLEVDKLTTVNVDIAEALERYEVTDSPDAENLKAAFVA